MDNTADNSIFSPLPANGSDGEVLCSKSPMHISEVRRVGDLIVKDAHPWTATVHSLLNHLERVGFPGAPRVVGSGFDGQGHETITFIPGDFLEKGHWSLSGATAVGAMLRRVHEAMASYQPPADACWRPWFGRSMGGGRRIMGHCDVGPWNIVTRDGLPFALIDWDWAGPVDPLVDLAQACWLNAKLHDDNVAAREGLSSPETRASHLRAIVDGYDLPVRQRQGLLDLMIEFAIQAVAAEADQADLQPETPLSVLDPELPWAMAWRARAAVWMSRNKRLLQDALM